MYKYPSGWSILGVRYKVKKNKICWCVKGDKKTSKGAGVTNAGAKVSYTRHIIRYGIRGDYINQLKKEIINIKVYGLGGLKRLNSVKREDIEGSLLEKELFSGKGKGNINYEVNRASSNTDSKVVGVSNLYRILIQYLFIDIEHEPSDKKSYRYKSRYRTKVENRLIDKLLKKKHLKLVYTESYSESFVKGDRYNVIIDKVNKNIVDKYILNSIRPLSNSCSRVILTSNPARIGNDNNNYDSYYKSKKALEDLVHNYIEGVIYLEADIVNGVNTKLLKEMGETFNNTPQLVNTPDFYKHRYRGNKCNKQLPDNQDLPRIRTVDSGYINIKYKEIPVTRVNKLKTLEEWCTYKTKVKRINLTEGLKAIYRKEIEDQKSISNAPVTLVKNIVLKRQLEGNYISEALVMSMFLDTFFGTHSLTHDPLNSYIENISEIEKTALKAYSYTKVLGYIVKIVEKRVWFDAKQHKVKYLLKWERADNIPYVVADDIDLPPDWLPK